MASSLDLVKSDFDRAVLEYRNAIITGFYARYMGEVHLLAMENNIIELFTKCEAENRNDLKYSLLRILIEPTLDESYRLDYLLLNRAQKLIGKLEKIA